MINNNAVNNPYGQNAALISLVQLLARQAAKEAMAAAQGEHPIVAQGT